MLETSHERVELLKAGINGKTIEKLYLLYNNIKIVNSHALFKPVEINIRENMEKYLSREAPVEYGEAALLE